MDVCRINGLMSELRLFLLAQTLSWLRHVFRCKLHSLAIFGGDWKGA